MAKNYQTKTMSFFTANTITTISITMVLVLLGLTILVGLTNKSLTNLFKDNFGFLIEIPGDTPEDEILQIQTELQNNPYIRKSTYISKDEVKKRIVADLGTDPTELLGYIPTLSFFEINMKGEYVSEEYLSEMKQSLGELKILENTVLDDSEIQNMNKKLSIAGFILLFLTVLMVIIAFVLIRSIIQLNIYSKRFLINTMQLVGATNSFIRAPFMKAMLVCGIIAGLISSCIILAIIYYFANVFPNILRIINTNMLIITLVSIMLSGILISLFATASTVNKYLKMTTDKLYRI